MSEHLLNFFRVDNEKRMNRDGQNILESLPSQRVIIVSLLFEEILQ